MALGSWVPAAAGDGGLAEEVEPLGAALRMDG